MTDRVPDKLSAWNRLTSLARKTPPEEAPLAAPPGFAERVLAGRPRPASAEPGWAIEDWLAVRAAIAAALLAAVLVGWNADLLRSGSDAPLALEELVELEPMP